MLVSIIIPVYNGSDYLEQSINSAIAQSYPNIEIIVVNDGSTDGGKTEKIIDKYVGKVKKINKENGGVSSALNVGIKNMTGDYFSWLSHDDLYHTDKILEQVTAIKDEKSIIFTKNSLIDSQGHKIPFYINKIPSKDYTPQESFKLLFSNKVFNGCSLLIPRLAFEECGYFDENYKFIQDWQMWIKFSLNGFSFVGVNKKLNISRVHGEQQTLKLKELYPIEVESLLNEILDSFNQFDPEDEERSQVIRAFSIVNDFPSVEERVNIISGSSSRNIDIYYRFKRTMYENLRKTARYLRRRK